MGYLKDVDYISAVSGGTWVAGALASQMAEAEAEAEGVSSSAATSKKAAGDEAGGGPSDADRLRAWYRRCVARTICRMQANMPFLARDTCKDPCSLPQYDYMHRGSSCLPRFFDLPILLIALAYTVCVKPLVVFILVVVPFVEFVNQFFGPQMRAAFCETPYNVSYVEYWGLTAGSDGKSLDDDFCGAMLMVVLLLGVVVHCLQHSLCKKPKGRRVRCYLIGRSANAVLKRLAILIMFLLALVLVVTNAEFLAYKSYTEATSSSKAALLADDMRNAMCKLYMEEQLPCDLEYKEFAHLQSRLNLFASPQDMKSLAYSFPKRTLEKSMLVPDDTFGVAVKGLVGALIVGVVVLPLQRALLSLFIAAIIPVLIFCALVSILRWRVFGPITSEVLPLFSIRPTFSEDTWQSCFQHVNICAMVILPAYSLATVTAHKFWGRSLRRAFLASGKDVYWSDLQHCTLCPLFLVGATVTDFISTTSSTDVSDLMTSALHTGGNQVGYVRTQPHLGVAKTMAMCSGAPDALVFSKHKSFSARTLLELTNLRLGDYIPHHRGSWVRQWQAALSSFGFPCLPSVGCWWVSLPALLLWEAVYALLLLAQDLTLRESERRKGCANARAAFVSSLLLATCLIGLSFFSFLPCFHFLRYSTIARLVHTGTGYSHVGEPGHVPSLIAVSDGVLFDNTGVIQLLRRRCKRILMVYGKGGKNSVAQLKKVAKTAAQEKLASIFDFKEPRRDLEATFDEFRRGRCGRCGAPEAQVEEGRERCEACGACWRTHGQVMNFLHLGILYGWPGGLPADAPLPHDDHIGHLFFIQIRVPPSQYDEVALPLLEEDEIMGLRSFGCNYPRAFPSPPTAQQCLTPQVFSCLCRLGHCMSEEAITAAMSAP
eukprot:TRINITY_DN13478_c0_g1_i5.p1 TRINITY_DN13478_c0_g1~~TRINITY_DN13478_c0_g1_i5.p1  ORF type:complete len:1027 (-),score=175.28 TRINITY_DN13478_c0_g1_i5:273-2921(-)